MERVPHNGGSSATPPYNKVRTTRTIAEQHAVPWRYNTYMSDTCIFHVQGNAAVRHGATPTAAATRSAREPQASSLTHLNDIFWKHLEFCTGYCNVDVRCMYPIWAATSNAPNAWEIHGQYRLGPTILRSRKVKTAHLSTMVSHSHS